MTPCPVVVVGHVDHGKTTLVRALTGIETDRLAEEKNRGLSILPGFAHLTTQAATFELIDAPGHDDFIASMIVAASGAQAALIVISATEGIAEQTREHIAIAESLGIRDAVVAVTKCDLQSDAATDALCADIRSALTGTAFQDARFIPCSAQEGLGLVALKSALDAMQANLTFAVAFPHPFLAIDRVFTATGHGTIVTGTLRGQPLTDNTRLTLYPFNRTVDLRGLNHRGEACNAVPGGARVAANLRGVAQQDVARGDVLSIGLAASTCMDVALHLHPGQAVKHMQEVRLHLGTAHTVAQLRLFAQTLENTTRFAQLRLKKPLCGYHRQRAILRALSPAETLGGVTLLDPAASPTKAGDADRRRILEACTTGDPLMIAAALANSQGGVVTLDDLRRLTWRDCTPLKAYSPIEDGLVAADTAIDATKSQLLTEIEAYHSAHPLRLAMPRTAAKQMSSKPLRDHAIKVLLKDGTLLAKGNDIALTSHDPFALLSPAQQDEMVEITKRYAEMGLSPNAQTPPSDDSLIDLLLDQGALLRLHNVALNQSLLLHREALAKAALTLRTAFPEAQQFTTSEARNALATNRKTIVPLLEHFDTTGITTRYGNLRWCP